MAVAVVAVVAAAEAEVSAEGMVSPLVSRPVVSAVLLFVAAALGPDLQRLRLAPDLSAGRSVTGIIVISMECLSTASITTTIRTITPTTTTIRPSIQPKPLLLGEPLSLEEAAAGCSPCMARASSAIIAPHVITASTGATIIAGIITPDVEVRDT